MQPEFLESVLAAIERELRVVERGGESDYGSIQIPDLFDILGESEATPYLRRALVSKARSLSIHGKSTLALAQQIALTSVSDMKVPRWNLVDSPDSIELYEALEKKFTVGTKEKATNAVDALADMENRHQLDDYERQNAKTYYLMGLIVKGRVAEATQLIRTADSASELLQVETSAISALGRAGYTEALDGFLHELLSQSPELPYWDSYFSAAVKAGKADRMLEAARTAAAKPQLDPDKSGTIRENLSRALLAADRISDSMISQPSTTKKRSN